MPHARINHINIYYETHGSPDNPTIVFLHGLGSSSFDWGLQLVYFQADYHIVLIDTRGHGESDKPKTPYSVSLFASDVISVFDHLNIECVHLVGLSMGGMIAFQLAVDYPQRILSMTIANSAPALVPKSLKDRFEVWFRFFVVRVMGMKKMGEVLAPKLFIKPAQEELRQMFVARWAKNDKAAYLNAMKAIVGWSVEDRIGQITIPTLVIASDEDYTSVSQKEAYIAKMQNARLKVIKDARHAVAVEHADEFNALVSEFLQSV